MPPRKGESIHVPSGQVLYVDVDETAKLNLAIIEGTILFLPDADDNHQRCVYFNMVMVHNGGLF